MNCQRWQPRIEKLAALESLEPDFSPAALEGMDTELAAHLRECAACRAECARLRGLLARADAALREELSAEPGPFFAARVRGRIVAEGAEPAWWRRGWVLATALAAVLVAALAMFSLRPRSAPRGEPELVRKTQPGRPSRPPAPPEREVSTEPHRAAAKPAPLRPPPSRPGGELEVLVPQDEMRAALALYQQLESNRAEAAQVAAGLTTKEKALAPLVVASLDIVRLTIARLDLTPQEAAGPDRP